MLNLLKISIQEFHCNSSPTIDIASCIGMDYIKLHLQLFQSKYSILKFMASLGLLYNDVNENIRENL